ncbi:MAG: hypothetical protein ACUVQ0_06445 [Thermoproteota archaeon]
MVMDIDRMMGIVSGLVVLLSIFLLPFSSFQLPSGETSELTLFLTVKKVIINIMANTYGAINTLVFNIMLILSFILLLAAGILGVFPLRSGVLGIIGMIIITIVSMFNPQLGFRIPGYGVGFFFAWGFSIIAVMFGKLHPLSRIIRAPSESEVAKGLEASKSSVGEATLSKELSASLKSEEKVQETEESLSLQASSPPKDLFAPLLSKAEKTSPAEDKKEYPPPQPIMLFPSPPVDVSVIEEEMNRIRVFLVILGEERNNGMISEEAYDRLKIKLERILDELDKERENALKNR